MWKRMSNRIHRGSGGPSPSRGAQRRSVSDASLVSSKSVLDNRPWRRLISCRMDTRREFIRKAVLLPAGGGGMELLSGVIRRALAIEPEPGSTFLMRSTW